MQQPQQEIFLNPLLQIDEEYPSYPNSPMMPNEGFLHQIKPFLPYSTEYPDYPFQLDQLPTKKQEVQYSITGYNPWGPNGPTTFIGNNGILPQITWANPGGSWKQVHKKPEPIWWGIYAQPDQVPNGFSPSITGFPGFQFQGQGEKPKYIGQQTQNGGWGYSK